MSYGLGIDVGTTYTAAAILRDGQAHAVTLGQNGDAMPTTVYLGDDGQFVVGDVARRRLTENPSGGAREFKRRLGDSTPLVLNGSPYSADRLMGVVIRHVVRVATEIEGEPPSQVTVTHPSNWQAFKIDLLRQAAVAAAAPAEVNLVEEPVAAAIYYAHAGRIDVGQLVGVYDLGGGTFDAAVLQRTEDGFRRLGEPAGIERLGGIDFDAALTSHVRQSLGSRFDALDTEDRAVQVGMEDLRAECIEAKQALSSDTLATINVGLPGLHDAVRITRGEFEKLIRPVLLETVESLRTALRQASATPDQLAAVLLIGGSSRIPLVADIVGAEIGRPVAVDAHPKLSVAMGAAVATGPGLTSAASVAATETATATAAAAATADLSASEADAAPFHAITAPEPTATPSGRRGRRILIAALAAVLVAALGTGGWFAYANHAQKKPPAKATAASPKAHPYVEIAGVTLESGRYRVSYRVSGFVPSLTDGMSIHFFLDTTDPINASAGAEQPGEWDMTDDPSSFLTKFTPAVRGGATTVCAVVVNADQKVTDPKSGNCSRLPADPVVSAPVPQRQPAQESGSKEHKSDDHSDSDSNHDSDHSDDSDDSEWDDDSHDSDGSDGSGDSDDTTYCDNGQITYAC